MVPIYEHFLLLTKYTVNLSKKRDKCCCMMTNILMKTDLITYLAINHLGFEWSLPNFTYFAINQLLFLICSMKGPVQA